MAHGRQQGGGNIFVLCHVSLLEFCHVSRLTYQMAATWNVTLCCLKRVHQTNHPQSAIVNKIYATNHVITTHNSDRCPRTTVSSPGTQRHLKTLICMDVFPIFFFYPQISSPVLSLPWSFFLSLEMFLSWLAQLHLISPISGGAPPFTASRNWPVSFILLRKIQLGQTVIAPPMPCQYLFHRVMSLPLCVAASDCWWKK